MADEDLNEVVDRGDNLPPEELEDTPEAETPATEEELELPPAVTDSLEDELEETEDERAAREAEEAEAEKKKRIRIPKARLDEVMTKARRREDELNNKILELQRQIDGSKEVDKTAEIEREVDELEDKYEELLLDGKKDEARAVRKQIRAMNNALIDQKTATQSNAARHAAVEDLRYDAALANIEATFPALNPDTENYDQEKVGEVSVLLSAFQSQGFKRDVALQKAVKYVMGEPSKKDDTAALRAARDVDARKKAAEASRRQPVDTKGIGADSDKGGKAAENAGIDVMRLSQDKFARLDEETLSKLRGDTL